MTPFGKIDSQALGYRSKWLAFCVPLFFLAAVFPPARAENEPPVYTVAKVLVDVEAENAVVAKELALTDAPSLALTQLLHRITGFADRDRLPKLAPEKVETLVRSFTVRQEQSSTTRYIAMLDYHFREEAIRKLLQPAGIEILDEQAPATSVLIRLLPPFPAPDAISLWREAWDRLDLAHSVTPLKVLATGELPTDLLQAAAEGKRDAWQTLAQMTGVRENRLVLLAARMDTQANQLTLFVSGRDVVGFFSVSQQFRVMDEDWETTAEMAAKVAMGILEGRWKEPRAQASLPPELGAETAAPSAEPTEFFLTVPFSGLRQWQTIRRKLDRFPGIRDFSIVSLSARSADISFRYRGGLARLRRGLAAKGLYLEKRGSDWVLLPQ